jgi:antitoxin YefM
MPQVSLADLYAHIADHLDSIEADRSELIVTRQNHEPMVILPLAELEALRETLYLLHSRANADILAQSIQQIDEGRGKERALIE